ncbi:MAG: hypothetical protein HY270_04100, partial [Deltaproteobacteria bacterium]|nr:hypothetical protein [Deltaproteobacteria bacterium]
MRTTETKWMVGCFAALGLIFATAQGAAASGKANLSESLAATGSAPDKASGKASLNLRPRKNKGTKGSFAVVAKHLSADSSYDLIVGGAKVGELKTGRLGSGRATFNTSPHGNTSLLGFDPRGETVVLRDGTTGTDDLVGTIPDDSPGSQACCLATGQIEDNGSTETECEDIDAQACQSAGGTPQWVLNPDGTPSQTPVTSCLPDPCNNTTSAPPSSVAVACCINATHDEGTEAECEDVTEAACATAGGALV